MSNFISDLAHLFFNHIRSFSHGSFLDDQSTYQQYALAVVDYTAKVSERTMT